MTEVYFNGQWLEIKIGTKVFIGRCGSGKTVFGEYGTLTKINKNGLVFTTDSGTKITTKKESLNTTKKCSQYFVSLNINRTDFIKTKISL